MSGILYLNKLGFDTKFWRWSASIQSLLTTLIHAVKQMFNSSWNDAYNIPVNIDVKA